MSSQMDFDPKKPFGLLSKVFPHEFHSWYATRNEAKDAARQLVQADPARAYGVIKCVAVISAAPATVVEEDLGP